MHLPLIQQFLSEEICRRLKVNILCGITGTSTTTDTAWWPLRGTGHDGTFIQWRATQLLSEGMRTPSPMD